MKNFTIEDSLIDESLLSKFNDWWLNINPDLHYLVMTDDADSFYSCQRLKRISGVEIGGFYDFKKGLFTNEEITDYGWKTPIYVDLSICQEQLCFDNHRTFIENSNAINPNKIKREYRNKYNFSTLTLISALYGGVEDMTEEQLNCLIAIDGGYIGYYKDGGRWKDVNIYWLEKLGLKDYLLPILEEHDNQYWIDFISDYGLREKIYINNEGYLETVGQYKLPTYKFDLEQAIENRVGVSLLEAQRIHKQEKILTSAETYKDKYILNLAV